MGGEGGGGRGGVGGEGWEGVVGVRGDEWVGCLRGREAKQAARQGGR